MSNIGNSIYTAPHRSNAALRFRSDSPYQQRTTERDNPTQLLIKQAVDYLIKQLEAGKSETLTAYLTAMAKFRKYSFANVLSIVRACPQATYVAGIRTWNELGRFVKKRRKRHSDSRSRDLPSAQEAKRSRRKQKRTTTIRVGRIPHCACLGSSRGSIELQFFVK
jgi:hypothetical protein